MKLMKWALVKGLKIFIKYRDRFLRKKYALQLKIQELSQGGHVTFGSNLQMNQPTIFQGKGDLYLNNGVILGYSIGGAPSLPILLQPREIYAQIIIGKESIIANGTEIIAREKVVLGEKCRIGARCIILDSDFHGLRPQERNTSGKVAKVIIGDNVWLGMGVMVLKGVVIGDDAVIGAGCVVTKSVPAGAIAVGNPMKIVGSVYDD